MADRHPARGRPSAALDPVRRGLPPRRRRRAAAAGPATRSARRSPARARARRRPGTSRPSAPCSITSHGPPQLSKLTTASPLRHRLEQRERQPLDARAEREHRGRLELGLDVAHLARRAPRARSSRSSAISAASARRAGPPPQIRSRQSGVRLGHPRERPDQPVVALRPARAAPPPTTTGRLQPRGRRRRSAAPRSGSPTPARRPRAARARARRARRRRRARGSGARSRAAAARGRPRTRCAPTPPAPAPRRAPATSRLSAGRVPIRTSGRDARRWRTSWTSLHSVIRRCMRSPGNSRQPGSRRSRLAVRPAGAGPAVVGGRHRHAGREREERLLARPPHAQHLDLVPPGEPPGDGEHRADRAAHAPGVDEQDRDLRDGAHGRAPAPRQPRGRRARPGRPRDGPSASTCSAAPGAAGRRWPARRGSFGGAPSVRRRAGAGDSPQEGEAGPSCGQPVERRASRIRPPRGMRRRAAAPDSVVVRRSSGANTPGPLSTTITRESARCSPRAATARSGRRSEVRVSTASVDPNPTPGAGGRRAPAGSSGRTRCCRRSRSRRAGRGSP